MKRFSYTEYRLAQKADIKNATLNNTMKGNNSWIQATYLYRISRVFDVSMEFLVTGEKTMQDGDSKISELKELNLALIKETQTLIERNKKLEKALQAFIPSTPAKTKELTAKHSKN
ncbi:MAG: hypothetical protein ABI528_03235 [bacterium]